MATFPQIKTRIVTHYRSLSTRKEKVRFLYQVQERLRLVHNVKGKQFRDGDLTEAQWLNFKTKWKQVNVAVSERIAPLREACFKTDYGLTEPTDQKDDTNHDLWFEKKKELKSELTYKSNIDTIWQ